MIEVDGLYYMFYAGGGPDNADFAINLATSPDLETWTRHPDGPLFRDGYDARDPFVIRIDDQWAMYYTATSEPAGGNHTVMYRTSDDLIHWGERQTAFTDPEVGTWGGGTSPRSSSNATTAGTCSSAPAGAEYVGTDVFRSDDPFDFEGAELVGHIESHAAEVVVDGDDWFVTAAGWDQGGLHLAPLTWQP